MHNFKKKDKMQLFLNEAAKLQKISNSLLSPIHESILTLKQLLMHFCLVNTLYSFKKIKDKQPKSRLSFIQFFRNQDVVSHIQFQIPLQLRFGRRNSIKQPCTSSVYESTTTIQDFG